MKIVAHAIQGQRVRLQARHGIWPLCYYRTYVGRDDCWRYQPGDNPMSAWFTVQGATRAKLTRYFTERFE